MSEYDISRILFAVKNHTTGRNATDGISACLWDADRIRLSWERGYRADFFSTERGMQIASLNRQKQQEYIAEQEEFLVQHNIRTRDQIEFDKLQDMIQNSTQFKMHTR